MKQADCSKTLCPFAFFFLGTAHKDRNTQRTKNEKKERKEEKQPSLLYQLVSNIIMEMDNKEWQSSKAHSFLLQLFQKPQSCPYPLTSDHQAISNQNDRAIWLVEDEH